MANPLALGNSVFGTVSTTGSAAVTVIAAPTAGKRIMVTDLELGNSSGSDVAVTLNDGASTVILVPQHASVVKSFETPLMVAAATAFTFTPASGTTTAYCSAQGYLADGGTL